MAIGILTEQGMSCYQHTLPIYSEMEGRSSKGKLIPQFQTILQKFKDIENYIIPHKAKHSDATLHSTILAFKEIIKILNTEDKGQIAGFAYPNESSLLWA